MTDFCERLHELRVDRLKPLAQRLGVAKKLTRKADIVRKIGKYLIDNTEEFLCQLSERELSVVQELVHNDGQVGYQLIDAKYGEAAPKSRHSSISGRSHKKEPPSLLPLIVSEDGYHFRMSDVVVQLLSPHVSKPPVVQIRGITELPETYSPESCWGAQDRNPRRIQVHLSEKCALTELGQVLRLVQSGRVKVSDKSRRPTAGTVRTIEKVLVGGDFDLEAPGGAEGANKNTPGNVRSHAWPVLLQQLEWARSRKGVLTLTKIGKEVLEGSLAEALERWVEHFINDDDFDEFNRVTHIRGQTGKGKRYMTDVWERRSLITDAMFEWPVGEWLTFDVAYRHICATGSSYDVSDNPMMLYLCEARYGYFTNGGGLNRLYLRAFLMESLATLGLVDIAYVSPHRLWPDISENWGMDAHAFCSAYDGLLYVRLNALGAYCLGVKDTYEPPRPSEKNLQVLPTQEIVVAGPEDLQAGDRAILETFSVQKSDRVWALDRARLLDHLELGGAIDGMRRFLDSHAANELPQTVVDFFESANSKVHAATKVEEAILIHFRDSTDAALIASDSRAGKICYQAENGHLVVPKKNERAFRTALKRLGFILPR